MTKVAWRECATFAGYKASSLGAVKSENGRILKARKNNAGYLKISRVRCPDGIRRTKSVHQLVADAWLGVCPEGKEVNHIDHDKTNNAATNLEYITHAQNISEVAHRRGFPSKSGSRSVLFGKTWAQIRKQKIAKAN